jgi:hypothetical protein
MYRSRCSEASADLGLQAATGPVGPAVAVVGLILKPPAGKRLSLSDSADSFPWVRWKDPAGSIQEQAAMQQAETVDSVLLAEPDPIGLVQRSLPEFASS